MCGLTPGSYKNRSLTMSSKWKRNFESNSNWTDLKLEIGGVGNWLGWFQVIQNNCVLTISSENYCYLFQEKLTYCYLLVSQYIFTKYWRHKWLFQRGTQSTFHDLFLDCHNDIYVWAVGWAWNIHILQTQNYIFTSI